MAQFRIHLMETRWSVQHLVQNYWCCCGTQIGIGWGPGLTRELARWMVHGAADISMRDYDPRRFGEYATKDWQVTKAHEDYCLRHEIPFPISTVWRDVPINHRPYDRLKEKGAVYEEVYGHERPRWFAKNGVNSAIITVSNATKCMTLWRRMPRGAKALGSWIFPLYQG